ncbi:hypothetical protein Q3Y53_01295 [Synechococcus sp. YX-04-1]|uniref:hypothetical protein n=1 Tax=Synechococcus sp. YX-04-1 TaxID=3062778 RepID=UPI0026E33A93|nr:hypothetical protein [Synechococcus sp. YX-04-1]MDO6351165.1 hypothetical protein [Synechococcus sp. YX-04-1]
MNPTNSAFGVLYVATGKSYVSEAISSAQTSKLYDPSIAIHLCCDSIYDLDLSCFNSISILDSPSYSYRDKVAALLSPPFEKTLFLDTDAFIISPISHLQSSIFNFDLSACFAPCRIPAGFNDATIPNFFPEYNSGVLFLRNSETISSLISDWLDLYDRLFVEYDQHWDQASLRTVLWNYTNNPSFSLLTLPPEFNVRLTKPWIIGRGIPAYILHGRLPPRELPILADYMNSDIDCFRTCNDWYAKYPDSLIKMRFARPSCL